MGEKFELNNLMIWSSVQPPNMLDLFGPSLTSIKLCFYIFFLSLRFFFFSYKPIAKGHKVPTTTVSGMISTSFCSIVTTPAVQLVKISFHLLVEEQYEEFKLFSKVNKEKVR